MVGNDTIKFETKPIDILNNTLSLLVLNELDSLAAVFIFQHFHSNYNEITEKYDYMQVKTNSAIEKYAAITSSVLIIHQLIALFWPIFIIHLFTPKKFTLPLDF